MSTVNIFFQLCNAVKQAFLSSTKTSRKHRHACVYPTDIILWRNYECMVREINVTNAIDLKIEIKANQKLKQPNPHTKIENSENRDCC